MSFDGGGLQRNFAISHSFSRLKTISVRTLACSGYFQMLAGTSTGAIVASAYKLGVPTKQILDLYVKRGPVIFQKAWPWNWPFFLYSSASLRNELARFFQTNTNRHTDITWRELATGDIYPELELVVTLWSISDERPAFLSTNLTRPHQEEELWDSPVADIITACCSAPVFFPARWFKTGGLRFRFLRWRNHRAQ